MKTHIKKENQKRMIDNFVKLAKIPSHSGQEGEIAKYLVKELKKLGCKVYIDNAGRKIKSETGNIIAHFAGTANTAPFLLSAHMDTVKPAESVKPVMHKNKITSDGTTVLGADDKAGIAVILETLRVLKERKLAHPPIEVTFTIYEEDGMWGAKYLDTSKIKAKMGFVLDSHKPDVIENKAPQKNFLNIKITGKPSHSGAEPEKGISAIHIAAKAMAELKLGRIDFETVSNLGLINGGSTINTIPEEVIIKGEARSHNTAKLKKYIAGVKKVFETEVRKAAGKIDGKIFKPKLDFRETLNYPKLYVAENHPLITSARRGAELSGLKLKVHSMTAGTEANIFFGYGISVVSIGCGVSNEHTKQEWLDLKDFFKAPEVVINTLLYFAKNKVKNKKIKMCCGGY